MIDGGQEGSPVKPGDEWTTEDQERRLKELLTPKELADLRANHRQVTVPEDNIVRVGNSEAEGQKVGTNGFYKPGEPPYSIDDIKPIAPTYGDEVASQAMDKASEEAERELNRRMDEDDRMAHPEPVLKATDERSTIPTPKVPGFGKKFP